MRAIGIILAGGNNDKLRKLTHKRAVSAILVGSCYRGIDFVLSNMSNSGIKKVAVFTQYNSRSLHDHLSSAKWWDLGRKQGGLFIFSPYLSEENSFWYRGTADSLHHNLAFLTRSIEPYVIISSGDCIYKMDFNDLIEKHKEREADISIVYKKANGEDLRDYGVLTFDKNEILVDLEEKPLEPQTDFYSTGIYIMSRTLLIKLLETVVPGGGYDFVKDILIRYIKKLKICGYRFDGYWHAVNSVKAYYDVNMDFLRKDIREMFTKQYPYIATKPKDEPPAKYNYSAQAKDCLVGSGSIINGYVEHSVIFRKVFTGEHSTIKNSIVMEGSYIGNNCTVEYAILDKEVVLSDGKSIIGTPEELAVIPKGTVF